MKKAEPTYIVEVNHSLAGNTKLTQSGEYGKQEVPSFILTWENIFVDIFSKTQCKLLFIANIV